VPAFDPLSALRTFARHRVRCVLVGGFGARLHGSPTLTNDLDLCHDREPANLERLAAALTELHARLRGAPDGLPFQLDAETLAKGGNFTFVTDAGGVDILADPSGVRGYDELERTAVAMDLDGLTVRVASIDDLIRMKQASARPKDLIEVEVLGALRDEVDARSRDRSC
jgi:hypothetical protein